MLEEPLDTKTILEIISAAAAAAVVVVCLRRRYLSALSDLPGPVVATFSASLWHLWHIFKGHVEIAIVEEHRKHGMAASFGLESLC